MCKKNKEEKLIDFIDDTVDIGEEPLPITDPIILEIRKKFMKDVKEGKYNK